MRSKFSSILIAVMSVLIMINLGFTAYMLHQVNNRSVIRVDLNEGVTEAIAFESLAMAPGDSVEYTVKMKSEVEGECTLTLEFVETELEAADDQNLKNFVRGRVVRGDEVLCDGLLDELLTADKLVLPYRFDDREKHELHVTFYLPEEVGNEAMGADAAFDLLLTASNQSE